MKTKKSDKNNLEITNSGFKITDTWNDICTFSKELGLTIDDCLEDRDEMNYYNEWRPRSNEKSSDLKEKTAKEASIKTKQIEEKFKGTKVELKKAKERIARSMVDIKQGNNPGNDLKKASRNIGRVIGAKSIEAIRKMEETIYEKFMLKFNPYYFDTEDFSVNIEKIENDKYTLTINIPDEKLRDEIEIKIKGDQK